MRRRADLGTLRFSRPHLPLRSYSRRSAEACRSGGVVTLAATTPGPTTKSTAALIECRNVSRTFHLGRGLIGPQRTLRAVDSVSLQVHPGEILAIVGESGSGKTTLSRMMLGLLQPTSGEIRFQGSPIATADRRIIASRIQTVFQDPYASLNPRKTVADIIALPLVVHKIGDAAGRRARVQEMLDLVGLSQRLIYNYPSQLSGGQRQRVAIARALAMRPDIVICDEPTSALDVSVQAQILNLLRDLHKRLALTYVFVSHDLSVVEYMADRVAVMYLGRIVELAPAKQLFAAPRHPYTQALLESVLTPDPALDVPNPAIGRAAPDPTNPPSGCRFHPRCEKIRPECATRAPSATLDNDAMVECHLYS
ncbi:MAG: ABC transporter ATP-binding protein [Xanthobacteraceae bacterium]